MNDDPVVAETRLVRDRLAARFGYDVQAIFSDLMQRQSLLGDRLVPCRTQTPLPMPGVDLALPDADQPVPGG